MITSELADILLSLLYMVEELDPHITEVSDTCSCWKCERTRDLKKKIRSLIR